jgi:hypothetical protein
LHNSILLPSDSDASYRYQLAVVNPKIDERCFNLLPGEVLCLGTTPEEDCSTTYVVQANEYVFLL